ncbi:hypothetical protein HNQ96_005324 [Aminobacter lissarensis]|uniref:Uncharacterized protein n=1 Tax=Aminobacter carboxidus TaxID=376165 RepID=A0A8E2BFG1_9HYPH|nr:hypothetical protein [Aminobacter lissarensis]MBB6469434.1 hypothetical protein [Aminobacter lissarensis]
MTVLQAVRRWLEKRKALRRRWRRDAQVLILLDKGTAYYEAQRRAARSRVRGDAREFAHWAKVAAEIARIAPEAEMDIDVVRAVVDDELDRLRPGSARRI